MEKRPKQLVRNKLEILDLKRKAKKLYITDGLTAKDVGSILNVSEKSIGKWVKEYGWVGKIEDALYVGQAIVTMAKLQSILKKIHPELLETIEKVFEEISKPKA